MPPDIRKDRLMRIRALLLTPALAAAALGIGATTASAAPTLFTTAAHTTRVTVGATATATATSPMVLTSGATTFMSCNHSTLHLRVTANNDTQGLTAAVHAGSFSPCNSPITGNFPWQLHVSSNGSFSNDFFRWNAVMTNVSFNLLGGTYTGNLTTGVTVTQPTATSPLCLHLDRAASVSGPATGAGRLDITYCLTNGFSLTNG
jgi:hypothetical protein